MILEFQGYICWLERLLDFQRLFVLVGQSEDCE